MLTNYYIKRLNSAGFVVIEKDALEVERQKNEEIKDLLKMKIEILNKEVENLKKQNKEIIQGNLDYIHNDPNKINIVVNKLFNESLCNYHRSVFWGDRLLTLDKAAGFYEKDRFKDLFSSINNPKNYDQYGGPDGIAWRLNTLIWAGKTAVELEGDFVECGVFKGDMSWIVANVLNWISKDKDFYLYDTFEGFSSKYTSEEDFPFNPAFLDFANKEYRIPGLFEMVSERFKEFRNIKVIKGVLPDILQAEAPSRIAYLHIDLNCAEAEIGVLEALFDRVVPGGIIIFDDYGWLEYIRQREKENEFMDSRSYSILELPTGQGLVVKR